MLQQNRRRIPSDRRLHSAGSDHPRGVAGTRKLDTLRGTDPILYEGRAAEILNDHRPHETAETAANYRGPWNRGQRCLQIASGFYEWHQDDAGRKAPYYIHVNNQIVFAFAALWDRSIRANGTAIESVVHITMPANDLMRSIHNAGSNPHRMPAILRTEDHEAWLAGSVDDARAVLKQYDSGLMVAYEISTRVNTPKKNDAKLIEPTS